MPNSKGPRRSRCYHAAVVSGSGTRRTFRLWAYSAKDAIAQAKLWVKSRRFYGEGFALMRVGPGLDDVDGSDLPYDEEIPRCG